MHRQLGLQPSAVMLIQNPSSFAICKRSCISNLNTIESKPALLLTEATLIPRNDFKWNSSTLKFWQHFSSTTELFALPEWLRWWSHHWHVNYGATPTKLGCCRGGSSWRESGRCLRWGLDACSTRLSKLFPLNSQNLHYSPVYTENRSAKANCQ